jgi:hypothetical protein
MKIAVCFKASVFADSCPGTVRRPRAFPSNCRNKGETFPLALVSQTGEVIGRAAQRAPNRDASAHQAATFGFCKWFSIGRIT